MKNSKSFQTGIPDRKNREKFKVFSDRDSRQGKIAKKTKSLETSPPKRPPKKKTLFSCLKRLWNFHVFPVWNSYLERLWILTFSSVWKSLSEKTFDFSRFSLSEKTLKFLRFSCLKSPSERTLNFYVSFCLEIPVWKDFDFLRFPSVRNFLSENILDFSRFPLSESLSEKDFGFSPFPGLTCLKGLWIFYENLKKNLILRDPRVCP